MTTITPAYEKLFSEKIEQLVQDIACCFAPARLDYIWQIVEGPDAVDAMRSGGMLAGKAWKEVSVFEFSRLDSTGVHVSFSPQGLACYLPMFMTQILTTRRFGWFEELLLPVDFDLEDVVNQFSGSSLEDLDNDFRPLYHERVLHTKLHLLPAQAEVVARYIEIAESYGIDEPSPQFLSLLKKYTDFWRNPLPETFKHRAD